MGTPSAKSGPVHAALTLLEDDGALENLNGLFQALAGRHQAVLVLDGNDAVIAGLTQLAENRAPDARQRRAGRA